MQIAMAVILASVGESLLINCLSQKCTTKCTGQLACFIL